MDGPGSVAVDRASGDLYVANDANSRIAKFDAHGDFLLAWGYGVADGTTPVLQTCGPQASPPTVQCFAGLFHGGSGGPGDSVFPTAVAVDQSSGAVYATEWERVSKYTSSGAFLFTVGRDVNQTKVALGGAATQAEKSICTAASGDTCVRGVAGTGPGEFRYAAALAIEDSGPNAGRVWVSEAGGTERLVAIEPGGAFGPDVPLSGAGETQSLAVDSAGDFYVVRPGTRETQRIGLKGLAGADPEAGTEADTFVLGNLPPSCSASKTGPITYLSEHLQFDALASQALKEKCGDAIGITQFYDGETYAGVGFKNRLLYQDVGQLTCTSPSGGSCSVSTVTNGAPGTVEKRNPSGALLETIYSGGPETLTLDPADNLYIGDAQGRYHFAVLDPTGEQVSQFGSGQVIGAPARDRYFGSNALAVDPAAGRLYVASSAGGESESAVQAFPLPDPGPLVSEQGVENILPTVATLTATINPEGEGTTYRFEYGTDESYGQSTPTATLPGSEFGEEEVEAPIAGLAPETTYHFRVVATNHCNPSEPAQECTAQGEDRTFTTPPVLVFAAQWASDVSAHSALLHGEINPLGLESEAWLEYGTDESYGHVVPLANLGDGVGPVLRQATLTGLQASTTYHYRFAGRNERNGVTFNAHGADRTFTTQFGGLGFQLPDHRVWEMVSPPDKHGARLFGGGEWLLQADAGGDGLAYPSKLSPEADPEGNRIPDVSMSLARREANGSWHSRDITPPSDRPGGSPPGNGTEYKLFSADLSEALVSPPSRTLLSAEASERTPYLRRNTDPAAYTPLVTGKEPFANVPPGTVFGGSAYVGDVETIGASPDLRYLALKSKVPLVEGAAVSGSTIYEWSNGHIKPLSVLPAAEGGALVRAEQVGSGRSSVRGAISADGSRVFWSAGSAGIQTALYVRDTEAGETARLDVVQSGGGAGAAGPLFQGASADGSVVFFTGSEQLTEDAGAKGSDLYRCELPPGSIAAGCATLTDISVPVTGGENAEVQGMASAVSEDGKSVYFVARGVLDEAPNQLGDAADSGEPNLYLWREGEGVRFIATLFEPGRSRLGRVGRTFGGRPRRRRLAWRSLPRLHVRAQPHRIRKPRRGHRPAGAGALPL